MKKYALLLLLVGAISLPSIAQYNLSGQILNKQNKPLAYATIAVYPLADSTAI